MKKAYVSPFLEEQKFTLLAAPSITSDNDGDLPEFEETET